MPNPARTDTGPMPPALDTPDISVEHLRLLAVSRGIVLRPLRLRAARAAGFAASLWMTALNTDSLEYASRFGRTADSVATKILHLAAGHAPPEVAPVEEHPTWTTDRAALRRVERTLGMLSGPKGRYKDLAEILELTMALFQGSETDPRLLAALDALESLREHLEP